MIARILLFFGALYAYTQGTYYFDSIIVQSQYRKFRLYVPNSYTGQSVPLIFNFHGYGSNAQQQMLYTFMMPIADTAKFILVYPEGVKDGTGKQFFNAGLISGFPDDVAFTNQLISHISNSFNINPNRIYSCGMSNGGFMSYYLSCMLPGKFAAIGSVTGSNFINWYSCQPGRVFPAMQIHGTSDATVPYAGSTTMAPIDSVVNKYRIICGLPNTPVTYSFANTSFTDNCTATSYRYINSSNNKIMVELIKVFGGGHTWPGGTANLPGTCYDFNASVELWRFFRQHQLSDYVTGMQSFKENLPDFNLYPNPATDFLFTDDQSLSQIDLFSMDGKKHTLRFENGKADISFLTPGLYFINNEKKSIGKLLIQKF